MIDVERLSYYNGRRLSASDLQLEQHYHLDMRRRLNQGLFTPGVVLGMQTAKVDATHVVVSAGFAIDPAGREMVLLDGPDLDRTVAVPSQPPTSSRGGYFLVARYAEERIPADDEACGPPSMGLAARIREHTELLWTEEFPAHARCDPHQVSVDCAIVLALVRLTSACEIDSIEIGVRQEARPTHLSQASTVAMEGEKDIDQHNPKVLHFQVRGGTPTAVSLYLWAEKFSSLYYSELGRHQHEVPKGTLPLAPDDAKFPDHQHALEIHSHRPKATNANGNITTTPVDLTHHHQLLMRFPGTDPSRTVFPYVSLATERADWYQVTYQDESGHTGGQPVNPRPWVGDALLGSRQLEVNIDLGEQVRMDGSPGARTTSGVSGAVADHSHSHALAADVPVTTAGASDSSARQGTALGYVSSLKVAIDGEDATDEILDRLPSTWRRLGDGTSGHQLVVEGTGPVDLIEVAGAVGKPLELGPHTLTFSLAAGGGKVLYNLYVE